MKKIILALVMLLTTAMCFAHSNYDEEVLDLTDEKEWLFFDIGGSYVDSYWFDTLPKIQYENKMNASDFMFEIGQFNSNENGLIDWVSMDLGGICIGDVNSKDKANFTLEDDIWNLCNDGKYYKFYSKEAAGLQINFFCLSAAWMIGVKGGYQFTTAEAVNTDSKVNSIYYEHKIFLDFTTSTYASFNIDNFAKIFLIADTDIPFFNIRMYNTDSVEKEINDYQTEWFRQEYPVSFTIGAAFYL